MKPFFWLALILLTVPLFIQLIRPGFFPMQDDLQAFRIYEMNSCFIDLQIPCRWVPDAGFGYGYPLFNYYSPGVYYLGELIHLLGFQIIDTVKILFVLGFIASALAMFLFTKTFFGVWPALVAALLYSYAPFKAVQVYVRGSLSEFWALTFFPIIFLFSYQLIISGRTKYIAWLGLSLGLILLTHNIMSFIFLPLFIVWIILWMFLEKKSRIIPKLILSILIGVGFSAFFTLPLIFERQYAHIETLLGGYFDYRQHFVDLKQLFLSNYFGYGSSVLGPNDDLSLSVGIIHWMIAVLAFILAVIKFKKYQKLAIAIFVIAILELITLFLMHQKSSFLWEKISILFWLQFPWRFLGTSLFLLSFLGGAAIYLMSKMVNFKSSVILGCIVIICLFILHASFFKPKDWLNISDKEKFSGENWQKQLTISIFDYLPIYAKAPPNRAAPDKPEVLEGQIILKDYKKGSDYQVGQLDVIKNAKIRLPLYDFPGMRVIVDGRKVPHYNNDCSSEDICLGLISFDVASGKHEIKVEFENTPVRIVGNILTLVSLLGLAYLFLKGYKFEKLN